MSIVRAKKHLGQHFLKDQNIACKITASLLPVTKGVLEIGPGMGVLTRHLLKDTKFSVLALTSIRSPLTTYTKSYLLIKSRLYTGIF